MSPYMQDSILLMTGINFCAQLRQYTASSIPHDALAACIEKTTSMAKNLTLSRFYPDFIQILSKFYPNFIQILS